MMGREDGNDNECMSIIISVMGQPSLGWVQAWS